MLLIYNLWALKAREPLLLIALKLQSFSHPPVFNALLRFTVCWWQRFDENCWLRSVFRPTREIQFTRIVTLHVVNKRLQASTYSATPTYNEPPRPEISIARVLA